MKTIENIDGQMLATFVGRLKGDDNVRVEVMPFSYIDTRGQYVVSDRGMPQGPGLPPERGGIIFRMLSETICCKTFYCSYDMTEPIKDGFGQIIGRRLETCDETHLNREYSEEDDREYVGRGGYRRSGYELRNILTAYQRVLELQELLPRIEVNFVIPKGNDRYCEESRDQILADALATGLEPFPAERLEAAT